MSKIILSILVLVAAASLMSNSSCSEKKNTTADTLVTSRSVQARQDSIYNAEKEAQGFTKATITDNTGLDGCTFMITLGTGQKLIPLNLGKEFMKDKMQVWVKYKKEDAMTVCMAGETVRIVEIFERK